MPADATRQNAPVRDLLVDSFDRHLSTTHSSLWSRAWDISDPTTRRAAAVWFVDQIKAWMA